MVVLWVFQGQEPQPLFFGEIKTIVNLADLKPPRALVGVTLPVLVTEWSSFLVVWLQLALQVWVCEDLSRTLSNGDFCLPQKVLGVSSGLALKSVLILSALRGLCVNLALGPILETWVRAPELLL